MLCSVHRVFMLFASVPQGIGVELFSLCLLHGCWFLRLIHLLTWA